jgi:hypothetical protein
VRPWIRSLDGRRYNYERGYGDKQAGQHIFWGYSYFNGCFFGGYWICISWNGYYFEDYIYWICICISWIGRTKFVIAGRGSPCYRGCGGYFRWTCRHAGCHGRSVK